MTQGAFAAVLKDNQILLVKPPDWVSQFSGHWNFPGGVVDDGESLEEGAEREVFEETSVHCSVKKLLDSAYNEKFDTSISIFLADYISGELTIQEKEISEAAWFSIKDSLSIPLAFDIKKTIEKLTIVIRKGLGLSHIIVAMWSHLALHRANREHMLLVISESLSINFHLLSLGYNHI